MSELENTREQINQIEKMIIEETDEANRLELEQTKADLEELLQLLQEQEEETEDGEEEKGDSTDELLGSRCLAPFDSDRSLSLHTAIIMEIESSIRVRVLFSHPTCFAMKACSHFLSSTCRFGSDCRFSHGYSVELNRIRDYEEPNYSSIEKDGLVLTKRASELWEMGRISAVDGQNVAVKLLKNGTEVSAKRKDLVPIGEEEEEEKKDESWDELKGETLGRVSVGETGQWNGGGVGMKLMMKMGYKVGEGLGKKSDGIVHAIQARVCSKNASLDEVMNRKRKVIDGKEQPKPKRIKKLVTSDESEMDIFAFINRKLEGKRERSLADVRKEKQELADCSSKSLGVKDLDLDLELKSLRAKHKKLKEGIRRNQSDKSTVSKMTASLRDIDTKIANVERKKNNVQSEVNSRNSKRKYIF
ncbi:unnamed protein product [Caenorhabditis sp. 36 PRJEB53466]|nr:unnamed protein product [Caenorhabditis sp. 36 PRJEB53466]